jgi:hypothetical protein
MTKKTSKPSTTDEDAQTDIEDIVPTSNKRKKFPAIVAFCAPKGGGKDVAAKVLSGHANVKFAGALKAMLATLLEYGGCPKKDINDWIEGSKKETPCPYLGGKTPRWAMQSLGTEWGRNCMGTNFWVDMTRNHIQNKKLTKVVITDLRFPNERDMVDQMGGTTVRIRPAGYVAPDNPHPSEQHVMTMSCDIEVHNPYNGVKEFQEEVEKILDGFIK